MEITRRNFLTGAAAMGGLAAFGLAGCAPKSVQADADEALAETGGETSATATEGAEVTPEPTPDATVDADVVVIGGGASGLCAAISAAQNGAKVVLFEKQAQLGGNGMMPEGLFAVNSPKQAELGIESPRKIDIIANEFQFNNFRITYDYWSNYIDGSGESIAWLLDLGVVIERVAYKPLRKSPPLTVLITAIGVSFFLEYTAELVMGSGAKVIPSYYDNKTFYLGKVPLGLTSIITLAVTVLSMLVLTFLVQKTKLGKAMRAVSEDMDAARLMGINVNSTISFTFAVGSALAGIGSVLYCCSYPQATPTMGSMLGLKAFVAAVLGGIGSIPGAMVGGIVIGLCECFVSAIGLSAWKDAVTFAILIIVLLFKPTGFLGRKVQEKV